MSKTLCKSKKSPRGKSHARLVCRKCLGMANSKKKLCKPAKIA